MTPSFADHDQQVLEAATAAATAVLDPPDPLSQVMEKGVRFVMCRLEGIPGNRKVPGTKVMLGDQELDKSKFSDPTIRLLPKKWRTNFNIMKGKAEKLIGDANPLHDGVDEDTAADIRAAHIPGVAVVSAARLPQLEHQLNKLHQMEFIPLVKAFLEEYPTLVQNLRAEVNDAATWSKMARRIPSASQLENRMKMIFTVIPITFLSEAGRHFAEQTAKAILAGIVKGIETEAAKLKDRVEKEGHFKSATFNGLKQKFQLLKEFSIVASGETLSKLQEAEDLFKSYGDDLHSTLNDNMKTSEKSIIANVNRTLDSLTREVRKDAGGRFRRSIRV